jgi:hypothetical protein
LTRLGWILTCLVILLTQTLLPAIHFAGGSWRLIIAAEASQAIHWHHHEADRGSGSSDSGAYEHQACHFCRLSGVALPPPRLSLLSLTTAADPLVIEARDTPCPRGFFRPGHRVRAPPPSV